LKDRNLPAKRVFRALSLCQETNWLSAGALQADIWNKIHVVLRGHAFCKSTHRPSWQFEASPHCFAWNKGLGETCKTALKLWNVIIDEPLLGGNHGQENPCPIWCQSNSFWIVFIVWLFWIGMDLIVLWPGKDTWPFALMR